MLLTTKQTYFGNIEETYVGILNLQVVSNLTETLQHPRRKRSNLRVSIILSYFGCYEKTMPMGCAGC